MPLFGPPNVKKLRDKRDFRGLVRAIDYKKGSEVCRDADLALRDFVSYSPNTRMAVEVALANAESVRVVELLIRWLGVRDNWALREIAARALGRIGDARATEPLIVALRDKESQVARAAVDALEQLGGARARDGLAAALDDPKAFYVAFALARLGDARAVERLILQLEDCNGHSRSAAAKVLVNLYQSGQLDEKHKALILAQRQKITEPHTDERPHDDTGKKQSSDCSNHYDRYARHQDTGIGVDFPV